MFRQIANSWNYYFVNYRQDVFKQGLKVQTMEGGDYEVSERINTLMRLVNEQIDLFFVEFKKSKICHLNDSGNDLSWR